jgi:hypothetical protein
VTASQRAVSGRRFSSLSTRAIRTKYIGKHTSEALGFGGVFLSAIPMMFILFKEEDKTERGICYIKQMKCKFMPP